MLRRVTILVTLFLLSSSAPDTVAAKNQTSQGNGLMDLLSTGQVSRITVIHVPNYIETRIQINQEALRNLSPVELSFERLEQGNVLESFKRAIDEIRTATSAPEREVRWGVLLFDSTGKERFAIFLDNTGQFAQVDGTALRVQGRTLAWINKTILRMFR